MEPLNDEFIDAYSDDLIYILEARRALFTHPLMSVSEKIADASFSRLYLVTAVSGVEIAMKKWSHRSVILNSYFSEKSTMEERINALYSAFQRVGINVDVEIFKDYLALRYLRDTILNGEWKEDEKAWVRERNFPTDIREFTKEHFARIHEIVENMMHYVFLANFPVKEKSEKLIRLEGEKSKIDDTTKILKVSELYRIIWRNLEVIDNYIYQDILKIVTSSEYYWATGLSQEQIESLEDDEKIRLFYLSAYRAGKDNHPLLVKHRSLADEAFVFWQKYWDWVVSRGLSEGKIKQALQVLRDPNFPVGLEIWPMAGFTDRNKFEILLNEAWENIKEKIPFNKEIILEALFAGKLAYDLFPNSTPLTLFTMRLPIVNPQNIALYWQEAQRVYDALMLKNSWYECVERNERYKSQTLDLCIKLYEEYQKI